ncbi:hypothetical protein FJZ21_01070 [Candidatus Pacearchaeota archaeon]|nr:hypothetical protein [Candidatus Pacearchaeota archaeon]
MKATIVAGPYASGKTTAISNMIPGALSLEGRVGAIVAESANLAPDRLRFPLGSGVAKGISFASVCCPTLADMEQALTTAVRDQPYDMVFIEPPGNMHPLIAVEAAKNRGLDINHVLMLVSHRDYNSDKVRTTFQSGLQCASTIGVTFSNGQIPRELEAELKRKNPSANIIAVGRNDFSYQTLQRQPRWSLQGMQSGFFTPIESDPHGEHYSIVMRVINPGLSLEQITRGLEGIAKSGLVERAKGPLPQFGLQFDIKRGNLEINPSPHGTSDQIPYIVLISERPLPGDIGSALGIPVDYKPQELISTASLKDKTLAFSKLYDASQGEVPIRANGEITYTFTPIDPAYKVACQIYKDHGDDSPLRMILVRYNDIRFEALDQLSLEPHSRKNLMGMRLAAGLLHKAGTEEGIPFDQFVDQHHLRQIREGVVPTFFDYASKLKAQECEGYPLYEPHVGPIFLRMADRALGLEGLAKRKVLSSTYSGAIQNMARVHDELGYANLSKGWRDMAHG